MEILDSIKNCFLTLSTTIIVCASVATEAAAQSRTILTGGARQASQSIIGNVDHDVFDPIGKYLCAADVKSLSAWFAPNLEIAILGRMNTASREQATVILENFFNNYTPRSFVITHKAGKGNQKYALGELTASGKHFIVTIFASCEKSGYKIQQFSIEIDE